MCGGGKVQEEAPTAAEYAEQAAAESRLNTYKQHYLPQELAANKEAFDPAVEQRERTSLRGMANADLMQAESQLVNTPTADLQQGKGVVALRDILTDTGKAQVRALKDADTVALEQQNQRQLNVVRTGEDKSRVALQGLRAQSSRAAEAAIAKLEAKAIERKSRADALNTMIAGIGGAAVAGQNAQFMKGLNTSQAGATTPNTLAPPAAGASLANGAPRLGK